MIDTEALRVNWLLQWILGIRSRSGELVTSAQAREHAAVLADSSARTLSTGLDGDQVRELWARHRPVVVNAADLTALVDPGTPRGLRAEVAARLRTALADAGRSP